MIASCAERIPIPTPKEACSRHIANPVDDDEPPQPDSARREGESLDPSFTLLLYSRRRSQIFVIYAHRTLRNPASGRVLEKSGMRREGRLRQRVRKWSKFEGVVILANLRQGRENAKTTTTGSPKRH